MRTIDEIRRTNLELAIQQFGGRAVALANAAGLSAAYISQIRTKAPDSKSGKPKTLGDDAARKIEAAMEAPAGWMDADHGAKAKAPANDRSTSGNQARVWPFSTPRAEFDRLSDQDRANLDAVIAKFVAGCLSEQAPPKKRKIIEFSGLHPKPSADGRKAE